MRVGAAGDQHGYVELAQSSEVFVATSDEL
jgi:hypothetical protein